MGAKTIIYIVAAALLAVLVVANWALLAGAVELNLLITSVQAPLALLLLLFAGILLLLDLSVHALREYTWRRERRTLTSELQAARLLAEKEEVSRTGALKMTLQSELGTIRAQLDRVLAGQATVLERASATPAPAVYSSEAIEPALIPPREARVRGQY